MAIEALAHRLAAMIAQELSLSDDDREIAAFALHGIFSVSFYLTTLLVTAWIFGLLGSAVMVAATVGVLRTFMGGAHASTAWRCGIIGATLMNSGALLARELQGMAVLKNVEVQLGGALLSAAAALLAIHLFCPADVPAKPITDPRQREAEADLQVVGGRGMASPHGDRCDKGVGGSLLLRDGRALDSTPLGDAGRLCVE